MSYIINLILSHGPLIGYLLIACIIFAESGLLIGFFLPGDSLLFTIGLLTSEGKLSLAIVVIIASLAAIVGDSFGYYLGHRFGPAIFNRKDSLLFNHKNVERAHAFFVQYGTLTIILARFIPIVRTFAPTIAGVAEMPYRVFLAYNMIGGIGWATGVSVAGYFLGRLFPTIDQYLLPIIFLIILISFIPPIKEYVSYQRSHKRSE